MTGTTDNHRCPDTKLVRTYRSVTVERSRAALAFRGPAGALCRVAGLLGFLGLLCTAFIEVCQRFSLESGIPTVGETARIVLGSLVVSAVLGVLSSLTGRVWPSAAVIFFLSVALGVFNAIKLAMRFEPLYPGDVTMAGQSASIVGMVGRARLSAAVAMIALSSAIAVILARKVRCIPLVDRAATALRGRRSLWLRGLILLWSASVLACATHFGNPGNLLRRAYEATGDQWSQSSQAAVYIREGFVGGTLANLDPKAMDRPSGYSRVAMQRLRDRYTTRAMRINDPRTPALLRKTNVVMVMSESFSDPRRLIGLTPQEDPIPFTHRLLNTSSSGQMLSPGYGGGTANVEFEALTSLSMSQFLPNLTYPYSMLIAHRSWFPSIVAYMRKQGP